MQTLADFWPLAGFLVERRDFEPKAWEKVMGDGAPERLRAAREALERAEPFDVERSSGAARRGRAPRGQAQGRLPAGARGDHRHHRVAGHLRVGGRVGREETLARIDAALRGRGQLTPALNVCPACR